jgi:hypothetical protein
MKNGTYAIRNVRTGAIEYPRAGEARPGEVDLGDEDELIVWDVDREGGPGFVHIDPEPTEFEKVVTDIRAFTEAIEEKLDDLEEIVCTMNK